MLQYIKNILFANRIINTYEKQIGRLIDHYLEALAQNHKLKKDIKVKTKFIYIVENEHAHIRNKAKKSRVARTKKELHNSN